MKLPPNSSPSPILKCVLHILPLQTECLGKIVLVLDAVQNKLHMCGDLRRDLLHYFTPLSRKDADILFALRETSDHLGKTEIQLHRHIDLPSKIGSKAIAATIVGGAAAYFDGKDSVYINAKSFAFGPIGSAACRKCFEGTAYRIVLGDEIIRTEELLWPSAAEIAEKLSGHS